MYKQVIIDDEATPYFIDEKGTLKNKDGKVLKPYIINSGYYSIKLKGIKKGSKHQLIHRLVAQAFIGKIPKNYVVNHIDGNKLNNEVSNLEIITSKENAQHSVKHGMTAVGERIKWSKFTNRHAHAVCHLLSTGFYSVSDIAKILHVPKMFVTGIKRREKWKSISEKYVFSDHIPKDNCAFTDETIDYIIGLMKKGHTNKEILKLLGLENNHNNVSKISYIRVKKFNDYPERE